MKRILISLLIISLGMVQLKGQEINTSVEKVYVVFKTHLDVGFTDLSSVVTQRYITEFIPKALDVSEKLRAENASEKYVWTTGAWLIWKYLHTASPKEVERPGSGYPAWGYCLELSALYRRVGIHEPGFV